jgi:hypothetical protein
LAAHPGAEFGIVVAAAVQLAHPSHDAVRPVGNCRHKPLAKKICHLERQAQRDGVGSPRPGVATRFHHRLKLMIGQRRNQR